MPARSCCFGLVVVLVLSCGDGGVGWVMCVSGILVGSRERRELRRFIRFAGALFNACIYTGP
jgi:hypothetical protein